MKKIAVTGPRRLLVFPDIVLYYCSMKFGRIHEVFASIQGEGPWVGERHIFVRFQGCDMQCCYCDTPSSLSRESPARDQELFRAQVTLGSSATYDRLPNPVSPSGLAELCSRLTVAGPSRQTISVTGGEPLLQREFLSGWLPLMRNGYRIYLETNGVHAEAMNMLNKAVDVVSMDFKLPSSTGMRPFWDEHERFIDAASETVLIVKVVVTRATALDDVLFGARLLARHGRSIPFILQPAGGKYAPDSKMLIDFQESALGIVSDVRVIPQIHKILNVP